MIINIKNLSLAFLLMSSAPQIAYGMEEEDFYKKGMQYYNQKEYKAAATQLEKAAETQPKALNILGAMHQQGQHFTQNYKKAEGCYLAAFKGGVKQAGLNLGLLYKSEKSGLKDYTKALSYFQPIAQEGNERAKQQVQQMCDMALQKEVSGWEPKTITNLGKICYHGDGIKQDFDKAKSLFQKAMELGSDDATFSLAVLYGEGKGVKQDFKKAKELWYELAQKGNTDAMLNLGQTYSNKVWSTENRTENDKKAAQWFKFAAKKGNKQAIILLAQAYTVGTGVPQDTKYAKELLEKAGEKGEPILGHLGAVYFTEGNVGKALELWREGASKDDACSLYNLGSVYCNGQVVERDYKKAGDYLQRAAALGYPMAQQILEQYKEFFK